MGLRADPTYRQRRFGAEVRKLRERAGLSVGESAEVMGMHQSHISNVETGRTSLSPERLRRLARRVEGVPPAYVDALVALGRHHGKGWWSTYRSRLAPSRLDIAELESKAARLTTYEPTFIPVLLQTRAYTAANFRGGYSGATRAEREVDIEFRMRRQRLLEDGTIGHFHAIVHEAALHMTFGSRAIMREQLLRLIEASKLPNVTIQIVPFDGPVPFGTSFVVIEPEVAELGTVVVPHLEKSLYLGDCGSLARYNGWFAGLSEVALAPVDVGQRPEGRPAKDSLGLVQRILYPML
ncbi:helix-turn-helix transcriptional regulator [Streptomyces sp. MST-110588]|uniref:helix-turn-helix domain-containing protein n=1 Tax=Streptomyces sp. MST-110588 TaxID=2833628 RepID=UPI001F5DBFC8|nr:helix-turn-helix transcriptional regulator [Streptomyces sp. MST-110588]UNO40102.1 helix-turn-helix domain-containing protein [Streptomyces sp. MST-110588]